MSGKNKKNEMKESIARLLVENNIVRTNFSDPFVWTSGIKSPIYCDCRELIGLVSARETVNRAFLSWIEKQSESIDIIAGTATAGIPWAAFVAEKLGKPMLYVRSKPKGHGAGKMVEGRAESGKTIMVVEDAISTGGSSIQSVQALRNELNAEVKTVLGIFSWSTTLSAQKAKEAGITFAPLTDFQAIAQALLETGRISFEEMDSLNRFHENPETWKDSQA
jgi:orotate phosphoribosyltransferase